MDSWVNISVRIRVTFSVSMRIIVSVGFLHRINVPGRIRIRDLKVRVIDRLG